MSCCWGFLTARSNSEIKNDKLLSSSLKYVVIVDVVTCMKFFYVLTCSTLIQNFFFKSLAKSFIWKFSSDHHLYYISEHLPRLQPRPYSVCCSPLRAPHSISFALNVVDIPESCGRVEARKGVCTGWLERLGCQVTMENGDRRQQDRDTISQQLETLNLKETKV